MPRCLKALGTSGRLVQGSVFKGSVFKGSEIMNYEGWYYSGRSIHVSGLSAFGFRG